MAKPRKKTRKKNSSGIKKLHASGKMRRKGSLLGLHIKRPKCLVAFFSRTGTTKKLAEAISIVMRCDIDEIKEAKQRTGLLGFLRSGREAVLGSMVEIESSKDPSRYDIVIIGGPVWSSNVSSPVRSYLHKHRKSIKKAAFFCTCGSKCGKAFETMQKVGGKKPVATLCLVSGEVYKGGYVHKLSDFMDELCRH